METRFYENLEKMNNGRGYKKGDKGKRDEKVEEKKD